MCQAAAGQFRSTTQDTLIAVAFVLCSICSTVFFFNCFLLAYLLKLDIPALFRRSPVKGTYQRRFLRFEQWDRSGCDCRTSFTPPSQRSHPTALPTAPALPAPPRLCQRPQPSEQQLPLQAGRAQQTAHTHTFYHLLRFS